MMNDEFKILTLSGKSFRQQGKKVIIIIICLLSLLLFSAALLFTILPTSIFGEASDLTHDQRDEEIVKVSSGNLGISTTTEGLKEAFKKYQNFITKAETVTAKEGETEIYEPEGNIEALNIKAEEFELIAAIIEQEAGDTYEGALAVASCVKNRIAEGSWDGEWERSKKLEANTGGSDPLSILTASGQFEAYISYAYLKYMGNVSDNVKQAVIDCFVNGKTNHKYTCFRSYQTSNSENIEGNWFFDPTEADVSKIRYSIGTENKEEPQESPEVVETPEEDKKEEDSHELIFENPDPTGELNWDLVYLITAYDASKGNLEGEVKDKDGNSVSRYWDLMNGIGEYIIKAAFGTEVEVEVEKVKDLPYTLYEPVEVLAYNGTEFETKTYYRKNGEAKTKIPLKVPVYKPAGDVITIQGEGVQNLTYNSENDSFLRSDGSSIPAKHESDLFERTEETETLTPETEKVKEKRTVRGLQKSVLLSVLGLEPGDPYKVLDGIGGVTNADYIEYSRELFIDVLGLSSEDFTLDETLPGGSTFVASPNGWAWPLDPNGYGAFCITSLMGTRESPGGIGSSNHQGTDIGAAMGVAIIAVDDGIATVAGVYGGYGNCVVLDHGTSAEGMSYETIYGHMSRINVRPGQSVKKGEVIGFVGSTGISTGPHLHFEVHENGKVVNGLKFYGPEIIGRLTYV